MPRDQIASPSRHFRSGAGWQACPNLGDYRSDDSAQAVMQLKRICSASFNAVDTLENRRRARFFKLEAQDISALRPMLGFGWAD